MAASLQIVEVIAFFVVFFALYCHGNASDCYNMTDCQSCVHKLSWISSIPFISPETCRWCLLDRKCHAYGSFENTCTKDIKDNVLNCPPETDNAYGEYSSSLAIEQLMLSAVAYYDEPQKCLDKIKESRPLDFEINSVVTQRCDDYFFEYKLCAAVIALSHKQRSILISYRGTTEAKQLLEEVLTILTIPKASFGNGRVQDYFLNAFNKLQPCLIKQLQTLLKENPDYTIGLSGHSLGGALASIAALDLVKEGIASKEKIFLYTYGTPRVGDKLYAAEHDKLINNSWRVVHYKDCVPHFPPCMLSCNMQGEDGPFHHRTEVFYDVKSMKSDSEYKICHENEDDGCSHKYHGLFDTAKNAAKCGSDHKKYFEIPVGTYCDEILDSRRKRSTYSDLYIKSREDSCTCFKISPTETSAADSASKSAAAADADVDADSASDKICNLFPLVVALIFCALLTILFDVAD